MATLHVFALGNIGCSQEELKNAMMTCKKMLLDDFSMGIEPVLYEFSVKTRPDFANIQDANNDNIFTVLDGQPKRYNLEVMKRVMDNWSDLSTRCWSFNKALTALKTQDDSFVFSLEIQFEGKMSSPAYIMDVDHASNYICPDHFMNGLKSSHVAEYIAAKST